MNSLFDAHCDTIYEMTIKNTGFCDQLQCVNLNHFAKYNKVIQVFAMFSDPEKDAYPFANKMLNCFYREMTLNNIKIILDREDFYCDNKMKAILAMEGAEPLKGDLKNLHYFFNKGVRLITLTWNGVNELGAGALSGTDTGLTDFGIECVKEMNKLGIVIDVSHLNENGFFDVISTTKKPIVASHSNSKTICNHKRNLTDEQFKMIIHNDGVVGINIYPTFLSNDGIANVDTIVKHIEHFSSLGGINHVGIGSDFDGIDNLPNGIANSSHLQKIFDTLLRLNYKENEVKKIACDNFCRVFLKNLQKRLEIL